MADLHGMRLVRALVAFGVGLLLGGWAVLASAQESYPAQKVYIGYGYAGTCPNSSDYRDFVGCGLSNLQAQEAALWPYICKPPNVTWPSGTPDATTEGKERSFYADRRSATGAPDDCETKTNISITVVGRVKWIYGCPSGGVYDAGTKRCVNVTPCPEGTTRNAETGECKAPIPEPEEPDKCEEGAPAVRRYINVSAAGPTCHNGCKVDFSMATCIKIGAAGDAESYYYTCSGRQRGGSCSEPNPPEPIPEDGRSDDDDKATDCAGRGGTLGSVNGVPTCLPRGTPGGADTASSSTRSTESTSPTGEPVKSDVQTTVQTRSDGTVSVTTTTTTTTGGGASGSPPVTEISGNTVTGTSAEICATMPELAMCRTDGRGTGGGATDGELEDGPEEEEPVSSFGGACGAFTCEGDAIQCAIARELHTQRCELNKETAQSALFQAASGGNDPGLDALKRENRERVDMTAVIDDSGFLGGGCIDDWSTEVPMVGTVTLPFSRLCMYLEIMGSMVVAFSMLAAMRIVFV